ncbi:hypothetical protein FRX31_002660 [Thalictrum thalictroides]|uniref:Uncharacterized protein n=1 Tax=Thalictrum thalictroides TaxID=46969 RepID=A0A7J6XGL4_THATH|nr:hypothetical protein FRX31_002660 [Thalictrum thalictroides]
MMFLLILIPDFDGSNEKVARCPLNRALGVGWPWLVCKGNVPSLWTTRLLDACTLARQCQRGLWQLRDG